MTTTELLTPAEQLASAKAALVIPPVIVLCGSTRFMDVMTDGDLTPVTVEATP